MSYRQRSRDFPRRKLRGGFPNTDRIGWRREKKKSNLQRFFEELKDPMILILLAAALISGITSAYEGESYADVVIILTVVIINAVLGVLQESKAEKAIEALQEIAAATSKVMRGGKMEVKKERGARTR